MRADAVAMAACEWHAMCGHRCVQGEGEGVARGIGMAILLLARFSPPAIRGARRATARRTQAMTAFRLGGSSTGWRPSAGQLRRVWPASLPRPKPLLVLQIAPHSIGVERGAVDVVGRGDGDLAYDDDGGGEV